MIVHLSPAFLTGSPGTGELILLCLAILLLFGPKRLPEMARNIGKLLDQLRRASQDFRDQIMQIEVSTTNDASSVNNEHDGRDTSSQSIDGGSVRTTLDETQANETKGDADGSG